jgi:hypothetical protein
MRRVRVDLKPYYGQVHATVTQAAQGAARRKAQAQADSKL